MERRLIGVDLPQLQSQVPQIAPVQIDLQRPTAVMAQAQAATQEAYQAEARRIGAEAQAIAVQASKQNNTTAQVFGGLIDSLNQTMDVVANIERAKAEQKKLEAEERQKQLEFQQQENYADLLANSIQTLSTVREQIQTAANTEGIFATERNLLAAVDAANVSPQQRAELIKFIGAELQSIHQSQLGALREQREQGVAAFVANTEAELNLALEQYGGIIAKSGLTGEQLDSVLADALSYIDESIGAVPQDVPLPLRLNARARALDKLAAAIGDNAEAQAALLYASQQQAQYSAEAQRIAAEYANDPITRDTLLRQLAATVFGTTSTDVTSNLDVYQERLTWLQTVAQIDEITTPEVEDLAPIKNYQIGRLVFDELVNARPIELLKDQPGMGNIYLQAQAAREVITQNLQRRDEAYNRVAELNSQLSNQRAKAEGLRDIAALGANFDSLSDAEKQQVLQAQREGILQGNLAEAAAEYQNALRQAEIIQQQLQQANQEYQRSTQILTQYGFQNGLEGFEAEYNRLMNSEATQQALQRQNAYSRGQDPNGGTPENFPTRGANSGNGAPVSLPTVGHVSAAETNFKGLPAPFLGVPSDRIWITSTLRNDGSSHQYGSSIDFAVDGASPGSVQVTPLRAGRVIRVVNHHSGNSPGTSGYGNVVEIEDREGRVWNYAHLHTTSVRVGDNVVPGQPIGTMGQTGRSTGVHLHLNVWETKEGGNVPYTEWYPASEVYVREVRGAGLPPNYRPSNPNAGANAVATAVAPPQAIRLPSGSYLYQGEIHSGGDPVLRYLLRGNSPNLNSTNIFNLELFNRSSMRRASNSKISYPPNNAANNYGYQFIANQNGFRQKLHSVANNLGIPAQWLADTIAHLTGGTFNRGWQGRRVGLIGFSETAAQVLRVPQGEIATLNHSQQLELVEKYLGRYQYNTFDEFFLSVLYGPERVAGRDPRTLLTNPAFSSGIDLLPQVGNLVGRQYNTVADYRINQASQSLSSGVSPSLSRLKVGERVASTNLTPSEAAFLDLIARNEGTIGPQDGYFTNVGYTHRTQGWQPFRYDPGSNSTASGRYQFMPGTWEQFQRQGLDINNPEHQDRAALQLIRNVRNAGAVFQAIENNDYETFRRLVEGPLTMEWVGLSTTLVHGGVGGRGRTPTRESWEWVRNRYLQYKGLQ